MINQFFEGKERLEMFEALGKTMRMGSPDELSVSDEKIFKQHVENKNFAEAEKYLSLFENASIGMTALSFHWVQSYILTFYKKSPTKGDTLLNDTFKHFKKNSATLRTSKIANDFADFFESIIDPKALTHEQAQKNFDDLASGKYDLIAHVRTPLAKFLALTNTAMANKDIELTLEEFKNYRIAALSLHDLIFEFNHSAPTVAAKSMGEEYSQELVEESFGQLPGLDALWDALSSWQPLQVAAWLAEHLRDHFTGKNRDGEVQIIEDDEKYRLVFSPCGSGGTLKLRHKQSGGDQYFYKKPCAATWGKENSVTPYCTHCAFNEVSSIKRVGFPLWVTEYDENPSNPCGWTVYKDPKNIPEKYFTRLGFKKP